MASPTTDRRQGLVGNVAIKAPVDIATDANITLSGEQTIGGFLTNGSRVLVRAQTDATKNGIYTSDSGAWTRTADADGNYDLKHGTLVYVTSGSYTGNTFVLIASDPVTVESSTLVWTALGVPNTSNAEKNLMDHFGLIPYDQDPTHDNSDALEAALNAGIVVYGNLRKFRVTRQIWMKTAGSKFVSNGNWAGVASIDENSGTCSIFYDGPDGLDCVLVVSPTAYGIEPSVNLQNVSVTGINIDCNEKADVGFYTARTLANGNFDFISVTGAKERATLAMKTFQGTARAWVAYKCLNRGHCLGENPFGWASANCDQCVFEGLWSDFIGFDKNTVAQNTWSTSNVEDSFGIGIFDCRALKLINPQCNNSGGPGLYYKGNYAHLQIDGGYFENNCVSTLNATGVNWNFWFNLQASSFEITASHTHFGNPPFNGSPTVTGIRLTGVKPSRTELGPLFYRMGFIAHIDADWERYRHWDSDRATIYDNVAPEMFHYAINGCRSLTLSGRSRINCTAHNVAAGLTEGVVDTPIYLTTGSYAVPLNENYFGADYNIGLSVGSTSYVHWINKTSTGFELRCFAGGALSDAGSLIDINVYGNYST